MMVKNAARVVFSLVLALFLFACPLSAFAAPTEPEETSVDALAETAETTEPTEMTEPTETLTEEPTTVEVLTGDFPALTVNAISNYFPKVSTEYNYTTEEITITYWMKSAAMLLTTQWFMTYDTDVLGFSEEKNTAATVCPLTEGAAVLRRVDDDTIKFSASSVTLFDFTDELEPFAVFVFDVSELQPDESIITKVDLTVDVLGFSAPDEETGLSAPQNEVWVIQNSAKNSDDRADALRITTKTTLSATNFALATTAPPTEPPTGIDASGNPYYLNTPDEPTTAAFTELTTAAPSVAPTEPHDGGKKKPPEQHYLLPTGGWGYALISFGVITACAGALFVMRKKEIMF